MSELDRWEYLGGSDSSCVLGKNPYRPRKVVWQEKIDKLDRDLDNPHVTRGNTMEPIVETWIRENRDYTINSQEAFDRFDQSGKSADVHQGRESGSTATQIFLRDSEQSFVGGHPDGIGCDTLYEIKCPTQRKLKRIEQMGVPEYWIYQVQHYLMITGLPKGKLMIWDYDNWEPLVINVPPDRELHETMRQEYEVFWVCVQNEIEPPPHPDHEPGELSLIDDDALDELLAEYDRAYSMRYDGKEEQSKLKSKILTYAGDRTHLITDRFSCKISEVQRKDFSYKRLYLSDREE